ncbi:MAG TPA: hypothetical protein VJV78_02025 [Polyangiales bacterium]|nr:hypothetical protein [Polyangiales bacterium]
MAPSAPPSTPVGPPSTPAQPTAPVAAAAGSAAPAPAANSGNMPANQPATPAAGMPKPMAMDECGLKTKYPGDEYCLKPPPPDKGFQLHIGPTNYDNPEAKYILGPGEEVTNDFPTVSSNDKPVHFYYRQFRMRPGAHHNIITSTAGGGFGMGRRIGTSNHLAEDSPKDNIIAPENKGVGIPLAAKQSINVSLHSNNFTDQPLLREIWINFWYRPEAEVTEPVEQLFQTGSLTFMIAPHQETILGPYRCPIRGDGRMLWFYGHRHANNLRFSAWRIRGSQKDLFYEGLNWEDPIVLEYSSTVKNTAPNRDMGIEGGWSGVLDMRAGDILEWECHVKNKTDQVLVFANETYTAEMCIMDAELVGANCTGNSPL